MRAFLVLLIAMVLMPSAYGGGHKLHKKIQEAYQAHAHKHKMKKALHQAHKDHHLLHHHK